MTNLPAVSHLAIVAGGKGTRLGRFAEGLPKALVKIGGKPVLQHQLELAAVASFVGDGSRFGLSVEVRVEPEPLGTAGALLQSLDVLPDNFFLVYGDVMLSVDLTDLAAYHLAREADFTAFAHPNDHPYDSDLLEVNRDGRVVALHPAPHHPDCYFGNVVNAALYVVRRDALRPLAAAAGKRDFVKDVMVGLVGQGSCVVAYRSTEYLKDMGTPERLQDVELDWWQGKIYPERLQTHRAIFLDRDGTLNVDRGHLRDPEQLELLPGVGPALRSFRQAGYRLVLLTNQPVIARGEATEADVELVHRRLEWELGKDGVYLDGIYVCPHHPDAGFPGERTDLKIVCDCRKPATGLVDRACRDLQIDRISSWMVGDHPRDIEMARRSGLRSVLLGRGRVGQQGQREADLIADDLSAAAEIILKHRETGAK
ncbi:MAG: D,D-heptose 1,7-bisphosphate phosphatase [Acidobacteria bacterium]|nr:MAG: D,D-heptose 1,7-bisphosphate phosphatase [Acidobacteriota bacterium]